jgi:hypothetical protein
LAFDCGGASRRQGRSGSGGALLAMRIDAAMIVAAADKKRWKT